MRNITIITLKLKINFVQLYKSSFSNIITPHCKNAQKIKRMHGVFENK